MFNSLQCRSLAVACLASAGLLTGCLGGSDSSGGGDTSLEIKETGRVLEYNADSAMLVVENYEFYCDSTELIEDTVTSVLQYQVAGGKLNIWDEGECYTDMSLSGSSSTLFGRWTSSSYTEVALVPTAYRPPGCAPIDEIPTDITTYLFENGSMTLDIAADSSINQNAQVDFCFGRYLVLALSGDTTGVMEAGCSNVSLSDTATSKTAEIRTKLLGNKIEASFSHGGTTCALNMYNPFSTADENTVCTEPDPTNETAFLQCVESTGYFEGGIVTKRSTQGLESGLKALARSIR